MNGISTSALGGLPSGLSGLGSVKNTPGEGGFANSLLDSLKQVNTLQNDADKAVEAMFSGEGTNPAEVLTAVQKADLAFRTMMQIRNKLVAAYDELKNIRV